MPDPRSPRTEAGRRVVASLYKLDERNPLRDKAPIGGHLRLLRGTAHRPHERRLLEARSVVTRGNPRHADGGRTLAEHLHRRGYTMTTDTRLSLAEAWCRVLAFVYRHGFPTDRVYRAYVRAVRHANAVYYGRFR